MRFSTLGNRRARGSSSASSGRSLAVGLALSALCVVIAQQSLGAAAQSDLGPLRLSLRQQFHGPIIESEQPAHPVSGLKRLTHVPHDADGWRMAGLEPVRGVTIGPIESGLQPGRGYGSERFEQTLGEISRLGGNWISLTAFGRVWDLQGTGVDLTFEQEHSRTREALVRAVSLAHSRGLRVLLVPHLWLESGQWRAEMNPQDFAQWEKGYRRFALYWAEAAEEAGVDLLAAGVELRSWVTTDRAPSFVDLVGQLRQRFSGPITYAANWDDVDDTVVLGELDVIGINAFYPLHWEDDASYQQVEAGGYRVAEQIAALAQRYERPVLFTEFGYTTRKNTEIKPWLWPEELGEVTADQAAQARAYEALLGAMHEVPGFAGTLVWRMYADVADLSQEPDWGFSPWGKQAGEQLRRIYQNQRYQVSLW